MNLPEHGQRIEFIPKGCKHPFSGWYSTMWKSGYFCKSQFDTWPYYEIREWRGVDETEWRKI